MRENRTLKTVLLLRARNDPHQAVKILRLASQPGPAPSGKVPCSCARVKDVLTNGVTVKTLVGDPSCLNCGGDGFRKARREFGELIGSRPVESDEKGRLFDPYTFGADRAGKLRPPPEPEKLREPVEETDPWTRRPRIFTRLERTLDALRVRDEPAWYYVVTAYCEGRYGFRDAAEVEPCLGFRAGMYATAGVRFVEVRLPDPIPLPGSLQQVYEEREREALVKRGKGKSVTRLASDLGVDRRSVRRAERRMRGAA